MVTICLKYLYYKSRSAATVRFEYELLLGLCYECEQFMHNQNLSIERK